MSSSNQYKNISSLEENDKYERCINEKIKAVSITLYKEEKSLCNHLLFIKNKTNILQDDNHDELYFLNLRTLSILSYIDSLKSQKQSMMRMLNLDFSQVDEIIDKIDNLKCKSSTSKLLVKSTKRKENPVYAYGYPSKSKNKYYVAKAFQKKEIWNLSGKKITKRSKSHKQHLD